MTIKKSLKNTSAKPTKHLAGQALVTLLLCASSALAADWESIIKTPQYEILVDIDSFNVRDGYPFIEAKKVFKTPQRYQYKGNYFMVLEHHSVTQFDCKLHRYKELGADYYNQDNQHKALQLVHHQNPSTVFQPVINNTNHAALESLVCQVHKMVGGQ